MDGGAPPLAVATEAEAVDIVRAARADKRTLSIRGGGTRAPASPGQYFSTSGLTGVTLYEPSEMVISARSGTPLTLIEATLAERGQMLPFEPLDHRPLLETAGEPTWGGAVSTNASGPRRIAAGAARDSVIGARFVNGRGEIIKSGGRVMKNVTGLDLARLMAGARGTLGVITEATVKVSPRPETSATLVLWGLETAAGVVALSAGLGSPYGVSAAAYLPGGLGEPRARALLRLEGFEASVAHRLTALAGSLLPHGAGETLLDDVALWRAVRDAIFLAEPREEPVWRISVAPSQAPRVLDAITAAGGRGFLDWGGGLVWAAMPPGPSAGAEVIQGAVARAGGHARLVRGETNAKARAAALDARAVGVRKLEESVRAAFDPDGVFSPAP